MQSKKLFIATIALFCLSTSAFATGDEANKKAENNLRNEYKNAENVQWKITDSYIRASFYWNNQHLRVFYNKEGETIAEGRLIKETNLPLKAQRFIEENYAGYRITEAFEYTSDETGLCYYVSVTKENSKPKILQILPDGNVTLFRH